MGMACAGSQKWTPAAASEAASSMGTGLLRSIHIRAPGEIQPVTSRMRWWSSSKGLAKIGS